MALPAPNLDDRTFQELVNEAKRAIPRFTPEWTDGNVSDPGVTLIELFAWMVETLIYRLNQVPDKNYIKFLELIGVELLPPQTAQVDLTFWLSQSLDFNVTIARGSEVATVRTASEEAVSFTTDRELEIKVPNLRYLLITPDQVRFDNQSRILRVSEEFPQLALFEEKPRENNSFYLGLEPGLAAQILAIELEAVAGINIDPRYPPLVWEYYSLEQASWQPLEVAEDTTGGLNLPGRVVLYLPYELSASLVNGLEAEWIRCRARKLAGRPFYTAAPQLLSLKVVGLGGTVPASHKLTVIEEKLGPSNGQPGQTFNLKHFPVLPLSSEEVLVVATDGGTLEEWQVVTDFANSSSYERHFQIECSSGQLRLGPLVWERHGQETRPVQHGRVPPTGATLYFSRYRYGGGSQGNVGAGRLTVLKSSISYIDRVTNRRAALGGLDKEELANACRRGPMELRSINRAVTAQDFEYLALKASSQIGRAHCLQGGLVGRVVGSNSEKLSMAQPQAAQIAVGTVQLLLVPALVFETARPIQPLELMVPERVRQEVRTYLDERRLLTTRLELAQPPYTWVQVEATVAIKLQFDGQAVRSAVNLTLYRYLHPTTGGPEGQGWPFDRPLYVGEIYALIGAVAGVNYIRQVRLMAQDDPKAVPRLAGESLTPLPHGLLVSGQHQITINNGTSQ